PGSTRTATPTTPACGPPRRSRPRASSRRAGQPSEAGPRGPTARSRGGPRGYAARERWGPSDFPLLDLSLIFGDLPPDRPSRPTLLVFSGKNTILVGRFWGTEIPGSQISVPQNRPIFPGISRGIRGLWDGWDGWDVFLNSRDGQVQNGTPHAFDHPPDS